VGRDSVVGIATRYGLEDPGIESRRGEIFCSRPDRPCGQPTLSCNGYQIFPAGKRPGRGADHPQRRAPRLKKESGYTIFLCMGLSGMF
jgi:hypothetical protein